SSSSMPTTKTIKEKSYFFIIYKTKIPKILFKIKFTLQKTGEKKSEMKSDLLLLTQSQSINLGK
ncbi:MAG: hypothetical protein AAFU53_12625, partial [Cyanobacteria bacterium J06632_3]